MVPHRSDNYSDTLVEDSPFIAPLSRNLTLEFPMPQDQPTTLHGCWTSVTTAEASPAADAKA